MNRKKLEKLIADSFAKSKIPAITIVDVQGDLHERDKINKAWHGKTWQSIDRDFLYENYDAISFFNETGFLYFLPAYMSVSLRCEKDSILPYTTALHLIPRKCSAGLRNLAEMRRVIEALTDDQKKATKCFLEHVRDSGQFAEQTSTLAAIALRVLWSKF